MTIDELRAAIAAAPAAERDALRAAVRALPPEERGFIDASRASDFDRDGHPRRRVVRTWRDTIADVEHDATAVAADPATMYGHFAVFDVWSEIESFWEGNFMESIAPGAFADTIANDQARMRVTLNHGRDPFLGNKPLGTIDALAEDKRGAAYEVGLFNSVPDLVMEGLRAGQYGASFRFRIMAENVVDKPKTSKMNPRGIPERTIVQAQVDEFGPVTFPQYPEATANIRAIIAAVAAATPEPTPTAAVRPTRGNYSRKELEECLRLLN